MRSADGWTLLPELREPVPEPLEAVLGWCQGPLVRRTVRPGEVLSGRGWNPRRVLKQAGFKRADRFLDRPMEVEVRAGPTLGGVDPRWLRLQGGRPVALRWDLAQYEGWQTWDLAATGRALGVDLREAHGEGDLADRGFALCELGLALEAWSFGRAEADLQDARSAWQALREPQPAQVEVRVEGPDWLDTSPWDGLRPTHRARFVLQHLDGLWVGGQALRVRTTPPLRKGRRPQPREPRSERQRRLFSRWDQGIRVDEEGLFSLTPEALALDFVRGLRGRVLDGTCGVGALAIAAARLGCQVVACDLDGGRLAMAGHNAGLYGVSLELKQGDVRRVLRDEGPFDAVILDPPWGGVDYDRQSLRAQDLDFPLLEVVAQSDAPMRIKLPRSFEVGSLPGFAWDAMVDGRGVLKFLRARR